MAFFGFFTLVFLWFGGVFSVNFVTYNSTDLSYLSNGIQIPIAMASASDPVIEETPDSSAKRLPEMEWLRGLYNHHNWESRLHSVENINCRTDMRLYLNELNNGTTWAIKMNDASGRYDGLFFFGNDYWLGSSVHCSELTDPSGNPEVPPFPVHFFVAKVRMNINEKLTPVTRQLNIGQCLPGSCSSSDIRQLLAHERTQGAHLTIVGIRPVPGDYALFQDVKLHIIGGVGLAVICLVLIATAADYFHAKKMSNQSKGIISNNNNNNVESLKHHTNSTKDTESDNCEKYKPSIFLRLLLCFSAIKNGKSILNVDPLPKDSIRSIHGLRFLSIAWIILVHTYLEVFAIADNKSMRTITEKTFMYRTISNATFSVDTFFFISGFLVTLTYIRTKWYRQDKEPLERIPRGSYIGEVPKLGLLVVYRFLRLTPAYLYVLGMNEIAMRYFHSSSVFSPAIIDHISCSKYWWRNALYINNFFPQTEFCMLWSWYISNDMQFFIMATILLMIGARGGKYFKFAATTVVIFLLLSWATTFLVAMQYKYVARIEEPFALFDQLYDKPWLRVGPYIVGMMTGYFVFNLKGKLEVHKVLVPLLWLLSVGCLLFLVYCVGNDGMKIPESAFYAALGHTAWGLSLAWIVIACRHGYGGIIDYILGFRGILPLSRLTYCAYLVHPMIMCLTSFEMDGPFHMQQGIVLVVFFGNVVTSFLMSFAISLCFEAPVIGILRILFSKELKDTKPN
ncbi:nose resistant to fluoxetine protein 6 [Agrilus planipennis]|uniref:Nose resistant to fluoxetine protein 6 n=1 Tax=Agrilus planipennis TaxID=224129 RepID=A0A7F5RBD8_AGRPL|nr:nose resistant to fluoxetine protein 6 [Agrilus planipennis]